MSSTTRANQDINAELGVTGTTSMNLNATAVRNLACRSSGAISFSDCRWGINFPARDINANNTFVSNTITYSSTSTLDIAAASVQQGFGSAGSSIFLYSNGSLEYITQTQGLGTMFPVFRTWLTAGSAGDYTVRFDITSGSLGGSSSASGTDLALSTDRIFGVGTDTNGAGSASVQGNLIIKRSGVTLLTRPVAMSATAIDVGP